MNRARIVVLTVAICAGGVAAYLASGSDNSAPPPAAPVATASDRRRPGRQERHRPRPDRRSPEDVQWQTWPAATAERHLHPPQRAPRGRDAGHRLDRARALHCRASRSANRSWSGPMALASWRRFCRPACAPISTEISPETGAGGFILPNDRVDVLRRGASRTPTRAHGAQDIVTSEIILNNIRVLAIDQAPKEKDGQNAVVGKTVNARAEARTDGELLARGAAERHAVAGVARPGRRQRACAEIDARWFGEARQRYRSCVTASRRPRP